MAGATSQPPRTNSPEARRRSVRFLMTFVLLAGATFLLTSTALFTGTALHAPLQGLIEGFAAGIAVTCGFVMNLFGADLTVHGTTILAGTKGVSIKEGCDALLPTGLFLSAVAAFPAPWRKKLIGMLLGTLFLQAANLVRVISLLYLRIHGSTWVFDLMHEDVWQLVFIGLAMACFLCWLRRATPTAASAA